MREKSVFKDEPYSCQFTKFFGFSRDFLKWKQLRCIVETYFQQILYPAIANGFSVLWKEHFLIIAIFMLVETIIGIRGKHFSKKKLILAGGQLIFRLVETVFFSPFFYRLLPVFYRLVEKYFSTKLIILVCRNEFQRY